MNFDWILTAVLFVFLLIGTVKAVYKPWLKSALKLATIPVAFFLSFLLQAFGVYGILSNIAVNALFNALNVQIPIDSPDAQALVVALVGSFVSIIFFIIVYYIFRILLNCILVPILTKAFKVNEEEKQKAGFSALSGLCGALSGFLVLGILLMPLIYIVNFAESAFTIAREDEAYTDNNIYATLKVLDEEVFDSLDNGITFSAYKYTGVFYVVDGVAEMGGNVTLQSGEKANASKTVNNVLKNGLSAYVRFVSDVGDDAKLSENLTALIDDPAIMSIIADLAKTGLPASEEGTGEEAEGDGELLGGLLDSVSKHYANAEKTVIAEDLKHLVDAIVYLNDQKLLSELLSEDERANALSYMLSDSDVLSETVARLSGTSIFNELIVSLYETELYALNSILGIPKDDAEAYNSLVNGILTAMNNVDYFKPELIDAFVEDFSKSGKKVSDNLTGNEKTEMQNWERYKNTWMAIQSALSGAGEDKTYGYHWYISADGSFYFYTEKTGTWVKSNTIDAKYASSAPLCQYLTVKAVQLKHTSNIDEITVNHLNEILTGYSAWLENYSNCPKETVDIAKRLVNAEDFKSNAVTLEKMLEKTHFDTWTEETRNADIKPLVSIILNITNIAAGLGETDENTPFIMSFLDQFDVLGETLDAMGQTHCMGELPPLFLEGLTQDEAIRQYLPAGAVHELNESIKNNEDESYRDFMLMLKGMIGLVMSGMEVK